MPVMMIRRLIFITLPVWFYNHEVFQVQFLIALNLSYAIWYAHYRPEKISAGKFKLELFNESAIILLSYILLIFTSFVHSNEAKFIMGFGFMYVIMSVILINIVYTT